MDGLQSRAARQLGARSRPRASLRQATRASVLLRDISNNWSSRVQVKISRTTGRKPHNSSLPPTFCVLFHTPTSPAMKSLVTTSTRDRSITRVGVSAELQNISNRATISSQSTCLSGITSSRITSSITRREHQIDPPHRGQRRAELVAPTCAPHPSPQAGQRASLLCVWSHWGVIAKCPSICKAGPSQSHHHVAYFAMESYN